MPPNRPRPPLPLLIAVLVALPGTCLGGAFYLGLPHPVLPPPLAAAVYGVAIIGAAFVLSWAAEAAQVDISAGFALALLALLAVLPEYAVDFVFSLRAGHVYAEHGTCLPEPGGANPCSLALANMTGANRVLVGVGWPLVVLVATLAAVRARRAGRHSSASTAPGRVTMQRSMSAEIVFLGIATLYSLHLPLRTSLTLLDAVVLIGIFVVYAVRLAGAPATEPDLIGTSAWVADLGRTPRRTTYIAMFVVAAVVILTCAEHFAEGLVQTGSQLGVDQFLLVQWVAPLASEAPELIVACLYAARLKASDSLGTLLSSKVNQWTLLVGTIPIVFAVASRSTSGLPLDTQQRLELLLTAAQSLFAVSLLVTLGLTARGAITLFVLFAVQFVASITLPTDADRLLVVVLAGVYLLLALAQLLLHRRDLLRTTRDGLVTPYDELEEADRATAGQ
ncbi:sodium:proton exchanger [Pseudonocardia xinjiangensis]|uniref:Sodium:proton exchanger n=1 Tax=Pseudonocardia xinjiangensis TaxID=75289 RepID=A0ABX1RF32_9PSEU|nr:sodium:proton exchanger [Pseudonocardia xinjiangensis]NMH77828.1 sodium:proton exchanger [Pseudonocardia xinjiangensis]